jgi:hypothetical protein
MLLEQARHDAVGDGGLCIGAAVGDALTERLTPMPLEQIVAFYVRYQRTVGRAHQWELCAAAFIIMDYLSDDTFSDFKAGLVGLGRDAFERIVTMPDALADLPIVQAIAAGHLDRMAVNAEEIHFAAAHAYERRTHDPDAFGQALDDLPAATWTDDAMLDAAWSGRFGSAEDSEQIPLRLPRLHTLFDPKSGR